MAVAQVKAHNVAYPQRPGAVLHIHDAMVGGAADDGHARLVADQAFQISRIGPAKAHQAPQPHTAIHIGGPPAKGIYDRIPHRVCGFFPQLDDLALQVNGAPLQISHVVNTPVHLQILGQQSRLADAQVVDTLRHCAPMDQGETAGGTAGHDLQLPANAALHRTGDLHQLPQVLGGGDDGAVAAQVHAYAGQVQVRQIPLHMAAGLHHFLPVPKALPQVAQIGHQDDVMGEPLPGADFLQSVQGG